MSDKLIFAANWKMQLGPAGASAFLVDYLSSYVARADREVWIFPAAVALSSVVERVAHTEIRVGAQNVHWELAGAFTGEMSVAMAAEAGATATLVGHSERRHVFGETDGETGKKVRAALEGGLTPMLCVGETIEQREAGETMKVVVRQLEVLRGLEPAALARIVIAYEPVWAIGTGRTATPTDASVVHAEIRTWMRAAGAPAPTVRILYGGSVKPGNVADLVSEAEIDGVLVGGASLDARSWAHITGVSLD